MSTLKVNKNSYSIWSYIRYRWNIVLTLQLCVVLASVIAVMLYRAVMLTVFYRVSGSIGSIAGQQPSSYASLMVTTTATSINLICIIVLNQVLWINYSREWNRSKPKNVTLTDILSLYRHFRSTNMLPSGWQT